MYLMYKLMQLVVLMLLNYLTLLQMLIKLIMLTISPDFKVSSLYITVPNHVKLKKYLMLLIHMLMVIRIKDLQLQIQITQSLKFDHWNALSVQLTGVPYVTASWNTLKDFTVFGNTEYNNQTGLLSSINI